MDILKHWKPILTVIITIIVFVILAAAVDIVLAAVRQRFYTNITFIVIFGIAGVFGGLVSYTNAMAQASEKTVQVKWIIIICIMMIGVIFFFLLPDPKGDEYNAALKSYGITLVASSLFCIKDKIKE